MDSDWNVVNRWQLRVSKDPTYTHIPGPVGHVSKRSTGLEHLHRSVFALRLGEASEVVL